MNYSLEADRSLQRHQKIPFIIYQTFKTAELPERMYRAAYSWHEKNPEYRYEFFDDARITKWLEEDVDCSLFGLPRETLLRAFEKIRPGAGKADLFRYLVIYQTGGVYMDIDTLCVEPLGSIVKPDDDAVSGLGQRGDFHQWGLIYARRHPFVGRAASYMIDNVLQERFLGGFASLEGIGGPPCLDKAIRSVLRLSDFEGFVEGTHIFTYEGECREYRILQGDFFGGKVIFKYPEYSRDLRDLKMRSWTKERLFNRE